MERLSRWSVDLERRAIAARVMAACLAVMIAADRPAWGQNFLEKLEAATRKKLDEATKPTPASDASQEELPAPNATKDKTAPTNPPGKAGLSSILDNGASTPSNQLPLTVPNPVDPNQAREVRGLGGETGGEAIPVGVYLGVEVEDPVGGGIGVRVATLAENSPAWKAGFRIGDKILAIDGFAIANVDSMAERLKKVVPNVPVKFLLNRSGRNVEMFAVLQDAALASRIHGVPQVPDPTGPAWIGIEVNNLTESFRVRFGVAVYTGAGVESVTAGSPAELAGIRSGDVILEIDGVPVGGAGDVSRWILTSQPGQPVQILIYRKGRRDYVRLVVGSDPRVGALNTEVDGLNGIPNSILNSTVNARLQAEIAELRAQLDVTQRQLQQTQQQLNEALQQLQPR